MTHTEFNACECENECLRTQVKELKKRNAELRDKAWGFIEQTIIREGGATEDFVCEMKDRYSKWMED